MSPNQAEEHTLPRSTIDRIISHHGLQVPRAIRPVLVALCDNFVAHISLQSNHLCESSKKKTISHEHVIDALTRAGFKYESELKFLYETMNNTKKKRTKNKLKDSTFTLEQLKEQQQKLFESARMEYENVNHSDDELNGDGSNGEDKSNTEQDEMAMFDEQEQNEMAAFDEQFEEQIDEPGDKDVQEIEEVENNEKVEDSDELKQENYEEKFKKNNSENELVEDLEEEKITNIDKFPSNDIKRQKSVE